MRIKMILVPGDKVQDSNFWLWRRLIASFRPTHCNPKYEIKARVRNCNHTNKLLFWCFCPDIKCVKGLKRLSVFPKLKVKFLNDCEASGLWKWLLKVMYSFTENKNLTSIWIQFFYPQKQPSEIARNIC